MRLCDLRLICIQVGCMIDVDDVDSEKLYSNLSFKMTKIIYYIRKHTPPAIQTIYHLIDKTMLPSIVPIP